MGSVLSAITNQLNLIFEVLSSAKLVVWDALLNFIDLFIQPWRNLFWFCFNMYICLWSEIGSLTVKILVLPFRIYDAIQKEDLQMEIEMQRIQELYTESKARVREVESELEQILGECRRYKELLNDTEAERKAILRKFQVLQLQVIKLEEENDIMKAREERILKGIHERTIKVLQKDIRNNRFEVGSHNSELDMECCNKDGFTEMQPPHLPSTKMVGKTPSQLVDKHRVKTLSQLDSKPKRIPSADRDKGPYVSDKATYEGWEAAIFSSIFSVFLTLLVGMIAWQAQDPCVPLVVAVFMVVCMSLKTVAQFLLSIYNGPGFDAVALLSFNWFILGTLAYPVFPRIAQFVAPIGSRFGHWFLRFMGVTYVAEQLKSAFS